MLRLLTYLSPGIPLAFYQLLADELGARLGVRTSLACDERTSGPAQGRVNPFRAGEADIGFLCAPTLAWLNPPGQPPAVHVLPAAPVFDDARAAGRPVYFADVVVRRDHPADSLAQLERIAYNDICSQSGYHGVRNALGADAARVTWIASGSHHASLRLVAGGGADAAAIDSNVLAAVARTRTANVELGALRVLASLGPYPIQPVVARADLPAEQRAAVTGALLELPAARLAAHGVTGFVATST